MLQGKKKKNLFFLQSLVKQKHKPSSKQKPRKRFLSASVSFLQSTSPALECSYASGYDSNGHYL